MMEEEQYRKIIYGMRLKLRRIRQDLCDELREGKMRRRLISLDDDISALIGDYESD